MKKILLIICSILLLSGCGTKSTTNNNSVKINGVKARSYIEKGAILVDVRTKEEYDSNHIDKAINIPLDDIDDEIKSKIPEKDKEIIVYCQSGNRSNMARNKLKKLGYINVYDLGSINNW